VQYVEGNILRLEKGLIIHQVNCHGVMSKGASGSIQTKWPRVFEEYVKACEKLSPKGCLGCVQFVDVTSSLVVANSFSQLDYGDPRVTGEVYTDVDKLVEGGHVDLARRLDGAARRIAGAAHVGFEHEVPAQIEDACEDDYQNRYDERSLDEGLAALVEIAVLTRLQHIRVAASNIPLVLAARHVIDNSGHPVDGFLPDGIELTAETHDEQHRSEDDDADEDGVLGRSLSARRFELG